MLNAKLRPTLHVEGPNDLFAIVNLMRFFGVNYDPKPWPTAYPEIKPVGDVDRLLEGMQTAIASATDSVVGFVLDADAPLAARWQAVRDRLALAGVNAPLQPELAGFIGESERFRSRVGVWLMPDNSHDGKIEDFLLQLIADGDPLIGHATEATAKAIELGARFRPVDQPKGVIHSWLAWQADPGKPFGVAIQAKFFQADRPAGQAFAAWFKKLYRLS